MNEPPPEKMESLRERNDSPIAERRQQIRKHIKDLLSDDFLVREESVSYLGKQGEDAAEALVNALMCKSTPSHALPAYSQALEEIGKPSLTPVVEALKKIPELRTPGEAYLLVELVETLGHIRERSVIRPLIEQIAKLKSAIRRNHNHVLVDVCESARVRIHTILSEMGEKGALNDLISLLGCGRNRVRDGIVRAIARVGDRRALIPLLRLHVIENSVSSSSAQGIREAFRDILRREGIAADDSHFQSLKPAERATLEKLTHKAKNGNGNGNGH